jgi:hypothetical protein
MKEMDWRVGQSRRILHKECSEGKTPALNVTRKADGFWFYCHRCKKLSGFAGDHTKTPEEVKQMLENLKNEVPYESQDVVHLPDDCIQMEDNMDDGIPTKAYRWLWDCRIDATDMLTYSIKWSPSYQRVIIPIYEYAAMDSEAVTKICTKLIGWVGREVECKNKKEREERKIPKYLTRKSSEYDHIFFHAPHFSSNTYVIVEDILSAIRCSEAMHCNAIALLTTYFPKRLMLKLRKKEIIIWLDNDMRDTMLKYQAQMSQFKIGSRVILSGKDPKGYNDLAIRQLSAGGIGRAL